MRHSGRGSWMAVIGAVLLASVARGQDAKPAGSVWDSRKSAWELLKPGQKDEVFRFADGYKSYLNVSRSALTSTTEVLRLAKAAGFSDFTDPTQVKGGARLIVNGHDRAVILVVVGLGAHRLGLAPDRHPPRQPAHRPEGAADLRRQRLHALQDDLLRRHQEVSVGQPAARA